MPRCINRVFLFAALADIIIKAYIWGREEGMEDAVDVKEDEIVGDEGDFGDFFDEAIAADGGEEDAPTEDAEGPEVEGEEEGPTPEEEVIEEEVAKEEPVEAEPKEEELAGTDGQEVETLEKVRHKYDTVSGMYNAEVKKRTALEDEVALLKEGKEPNLTKEEPVKPKNDSPALDISEITEKISNLDSVKVITEEFGDDMNKALGDVTSFIYEQVSNDFESRLNEFSEALAPLYSDHAKTVGENHFNLVEQAHPDFEKYGEELAGWIETKPAYIRPALMSVYKNGAAEDVIDLYTTFKGEKGYLASKPDKEKSEPEVIDESKLEDMEATVVRKSPVTGGAQGGASKNDFDAAWDAA